MLSIPIAYTIDFEESDYQVNESAREVQVCLIVLEEFPISEPFSIKITATENVPSDALGNALLKQVHCYFEMTLLLMYSWTRLFSSYKNSNI